MYKLISKPFFDPSKLRKIFASAPVLEAESASQTIHLTDSPKDMLIQYIATIINDESISCDATKKTVTCPKDTWKVLDKLSVTTLTKIALHANDDNYGPPAKKHIFLKWIDLFKSLQEGHVTGEKFTHKIATTQSNLLEKFISEIINKVVSVKELDSSFQELKEILTTSTPTELSWFFKYTEYISDTFEPRFNFNDMITTFKTFIDEVHKLKVNLPAAKFMMPTYKYNGASFLRDCLFVLQKSSNRQEQAQYLDQLPIRYMQETSIKMGAKIFHRDITSPSRPVTRGTIIEHGCSTEELTYFAACADHRLPLQDYLDYKQQLAKYTFSQQERDSLTQIIALATTTKEQKGSITAFLNWAKQAKETSQLLFNQILKLFFKEPHTTTLDQMSTTLQALTELKEFQDEGIKVDASQAKTISQMLNEIAKVKMQLHHKKFPEKPLDEVIIQFSSQNKTLQFPLSDDELSHITTQYKEMIVIGNSLINLSTDSLTEFVKEIKAKKEKITPQDTLTLLAIARELIKRHFGIYPYNTQMLTILALINHPEKAKGRIAQVGTGEGKSILISMLAAYHGTLSLPVDIITSNDYLAKRDADLFKEFYKDFELTVSHNCTEPPTQSSYNGEIVYGTNTHFEFDYLRDSIWDAQLRRTPVDGIITRRRFGLAIIDEVDNLFLDRANDSARLAIEGTENFSPVYAPIYQFVDQTVKVQSENTESLLPQLKDHLQSCIPPGLLDQLTDKKLLKWLHAAMTAKFRYKAGRDYVKENNEIILVEYKSTGKFSHRSRVSRGVHEMIEAKEGLPPKAESLMATSVSHPIFFNFYERIYAVSGTCGIKEERNEVEEVYGLKSFDAPSHLPKIRIDHPSTFINSNFNSDPFFKAVLIKIKAYQSQGCPLLLLCLSIEQSNQLSQFLISKGIQCKLSNETQSEKEEDIISVAGQPGSITIATNNSGRGTNIILSKESIKAKGLHAMFLFYPNNDRVEIQGRGRAGRQGQPGSSEIIVAADDEFITSLSDSAKKAFAEAQDDITKEKLCQQERQNQQAKISRQRLLHTAKDQVEYQFQSELFTLLTKWFEVVTNKKIQSLFTKKNIYLNNEQLQNLKALLTNKLLENWASFYSSLDELYEETADQLSSNQLLLLLHVSTGQSPESLFIENFKTEAAAEFEKVKADLIQKLKDPEKTLNDLMPPIARY